MCWMRSYAVESQKKREVVYTAERAQAYWKAIRSVSYQR